MHYIQYITASQIPINFSIHGIYCITDDKMIIRAQRSHYLSRHITDCMQMHIIKVLHQRYKYNVNGIIEVNNYNSITETITVGYPLQQRAL